MTVVYIAGPYRGKNVNEIHNNIEAARKLAVVYWKIGFAVLCPHLNSAYMDGVVPDEEFLAGGLELLKRCDAVALVENWDKSAGTVREVELAKELGLRIFFPYEKDLNEKTIS